MVAVLGEFIEGGVFTLTINDAGAPTHPEELVSLTETVIGVTTPKLTVTKFKLIPVDGAIIEAPPDTDQV